MQSQLYNSTCPWFDLPIAIRWYDALLLVKTITLRFSSKSLETTKPSTLISFKTWTSHKAHIDQCHILWLPEDMDMDPQGAVVVVSPTRLCLARKASKNRTTTEAFKMFLAETGGQSGRDGQDTNWRGSADQGSHPNTNRDRVQRGGSNSRRSYRGPIGGHAVAPCKSPIIIKRYRMYWLYRSSAKIDPTIKATEDEIVADAFGVLGLNGLPLSDELPNRPSYRDYLPSPRSMTLRAKYFELKPGSGLTLYQHDLGVSLAPNGTSSKTVWSSSCSKMLSLQLASLIWFRISSRSWSRGRILVLKRRWSIFSTCGRGRTNRPGPHTKTYQVKITKGHVLPLVNFMQCLSAPCANNAFPQKEEILTALNILLGHNRESIDTITTIEQKGFSIVRPSTGNELSEGEGRLSSMASIRSIWHAICHLLVSVNAIQG